MWLGDDLLQNSFPRLLLNSENKGDGIGSYGKQVNGEWVWELRWRREEFEWEKILVEEFLSLCYHWECRG